MTKDVNLNGAWYTLKYGVKLIESGGRGGRVVNISSAGGHAGTAHNLFGLGASHYAVSKHALNGLTQIRVCPVKNKNQCDCAFGR